MARVTCKKSITLLNYFTVAYCFLKVIRGGKLRKESCIPESIFSIMSNKCLQRDYLSRSSPNELKMLLQELLSMLIEYLWYINNARYFFDKVKFKNRL